MISRKSAKLIGQIYSNHFSKFTVINQYQIDPLIYTFFYEENYDAWFLSIVSNWIRNKTVPPGEIMRIHTGETLVPATKDWSWERRVKLGQTLLKKLATDIIRQFENRTPELRPENAFSIEIGDNFVKSLNDIAKLPFQIISKLKNQLEIDGYIFRDGVLYFTESSVIKEREEQTILELLIEGLPLNDKPIVLNHLKLSEEHYLNDKWGDSISNSRNFLEAILKEIAHAIHSKKSLTIKIPDKPFKVRDFLEAEGFINNVEKEAISKVYGLISNTGSHPNMAEQDEARLMRHLALTFSQYVLLNYESFVKNNP
jgi:hypothetical protein